MILIAPHTLETYGYAGGAEISAARSAILKAVSILPNYQFIIKLHPSQDDRPFYKMWVKSEKIKNVRILWRCDTTKLIKKSSLLIVQHSTIALDGIRLGKIVMIVEDAVSDKLGEFDEFAPGTFFKARTTEQIMEKIEAVA